jgi:hypothetical protein
MNAAFENPKEFLFLQEELSGIFYVYGSVFTNPFFSLWVQMHERAEIVKGLQVP